MGDKFKTAAGELTWYALRCGYLQQIERGKVRLTLWHEGGEVVHVRAHEFNGRGRLFWEAFESLTEARKFYRKSARELFGRNWREASK